MTHIEAVLTPTRASSVLNNNALARNIVSQYEVDNVILVTAYRNILLYKKGFEALCLRFLFALISTVNLRSIYSLL